MATCAVDQPSNLYAKDTNQGEVSPQAGDAGQAGDTQAQDAAQAEDDAREERVNKAIKEMKNYRKYVEDLQRRLPGSFDRLGRFLKRGNCSCKNCPCLESCSCIKKDGKCSCKNCPCLEPCSCTKRDGKCRCENCPCLEPSSCIKKDG